MWLPVRLVSDSFNNLYEFRVGREVVRVGVDKTCGPALNVIRVGGACGPPPPVAAALASSLRAPSRGDPPRTCFRARDA
jgi:hypothetical protein